MIFRVVFDTNILFSAIGWRGNPHLCVQAARQRKCSSITCEPILAELAEQLRLKRGFDAQRAGEAAEAIRAFSQVVAIGGGLKVIAADPDDDAVVGVCCRRGGSLHHQRRQASSRFGQTPRHHSPSGN